MRNTKELNLKTNSTPVSIINITKGEFLSLHDMSVLLQEDKKSILQAVEVYEIPIMVLFHKYTVFSKDKIQTLQEIFKKKEVAC